MPTEQDFQRVLDHLKSQDDKFELRIEFGKMLMMQYENFTLEELERYNYLKSELS